jgi:ABC-type lipoprotein release transport system permease subunit
MGAGTFGSLWKIAARNTFRHKKRTIITAAVMTVGVGVFILADSMLTGMDRMAIDNMEAYTQGSIKVRNPAYARDLAAAPLDKGLAGGEAILRELDSMGIAATVRLRFIARVSNYEDELPVMADAVDPTADGRVFKVSSSVVEGFWLRPEGGREVVLGSELAKELGLKIGDPLVITAQTLGDATNADEFIVAGIVSTPAPEINASGLFLGIGEARILLDAPGLVTEVDGALPRASSIKEELASGDRMAARLGSSLRDARVDPISSLAADYLSLRDMKAKNSYMIIVVILLIAAVGIVNTILMSVYSRVREIGVLRAFGMGPKDISRLFTLEGLIVGLIGSSLGVACGALLDLWVVGLGIDLDALLGTSGMMGSIPLSGVLRGEWNPATMAVGFAFSLIVALLAARIPARKAARLEPTEALRFI